MKLSRDHLEAIARQWIIEGWQRGNAAEVRSMYAPNFVDLSNPDKERGTRDDNIQGIVKLFAAFPDFHAVIDDLIIDVDTGKVAIRWHAMGTQRGPFFNVEPTGKRISFHGIETLHIDDGLITERCGEWDAEQILRQLGALA